eukprot:7445185-Pyramimonas_sp.AAC.1
MQVHTYYSFILCIQRGEIVLGGPAQVVVALRVDALVLALRLEAPGPVGWLAAKSGRGVLDNGVDLLLAVVDFQLLQLLGQIFCPFYLAPSCRRHLLDVAGEVAA